MVSIKITQTEGNLDMKNLGTQTGTSEVSLTNRIQESKERLSGLEDTIEEMVTFIKENVKSKTYLARKKNIQEIWDTMKRTNLKVIGIEEGNATLDNGTEKIFSKIIEEKCTNQLRRSVSRYNKHKENKTRVGQKR